MSSVSPSACFLSCFSSLGAQPIIFHHRTKATVPLLRSTFFRLERVRCHRICFLASDFFIWLHYPLRTLGRVTFFNAHSTPEVRSLLSCLPSRFSSRLHEYCFARFIRLVGSCVCGKPSAFAWEASLRRTRCFLPGPPPNAMQANLHAAFVILKAKKLSS